MTMTAPEARAEIWLADIDAAGAASLATFHAWLGDSERVRLARFVRELRRRQFVVGRGLLRTALGRQLGVAPSAILLRERAGMAPQLVAHACAGFSISHSGRWVACAVSGQTALGLDIEIRNASRDLDALAAQAFDAQEAARWDAWRALPDPQRAEGFYQVWSEREARCKLGPVAQAHCIALAHPELSMVLCSAMPLSQAPRWEMAGLP